MKPSSSHNREKSPPEGRTLVVKRSIYVMAQSLLDEARASLLADAKVTEYLANGDRHAARFWSDVQMFLLTQKYMDGNLHIIEDDV